MARSYPSGIKAFISFLALAFFAGLSPTIQNADAEEAPYVLPRYFSLHAAPLLTIPLGDSSSEYGIGGGGSISAEYILPFQPLFFVKGRLDYSFEPIKPVESLSVLSLLVGGGINWWFSPLFYLKAEVSGGYYFGFLNDPQQAASGGNPVLAGGLGVYFTPIPSLSAGVSVEYRNQIDLVQGLAASVDLVYHFALGKGVPVRAEKPFRVVPDFLSISHAVPVGKSIDFAIVSMENLFPVFHKYYDDHPIGSLTLRNSSPYSLNDVSVSLLIKDFMNARKQCASLPRMAPGESRVVDLFALFNDSILQVTEGTKAAAEITVGYSVLGQPAEETLPATVRLYGRNAMNWQDDRRAAAFVTARDPAVLDFAKNVTGLVRERASGALSTNLLSAIVIHEALALYGVTYVPDPKTPFVTQHESKTEVDFLQFPRETLEYKAGDCDDLSILTCALLQATGVECAFITIPGHIFMAFDLGLAPADARRLYPQAGDLIFEGNTVWVPLEITEIRGGFFSAWQIGAREWREASKQGKPALLPLRDAWNVYEPVGLRSKELQVTLPVSAILKAFEAQKDGLVKEMVSSRAESIRLRLKQSGENARLRNSLGVLYAEFGLLDEAEREFRAVLVKEEYPPALANLATILFAHGAWKDALEMYERSLRKDPYNTKALLGMARASKQLGDTARVKDAYGKLQKLEPELASRFADVQQEGSPGGRASEQNVLTRSLLWQDE